MPVIDKDPREILSDYQKDLERWKEKGAHYKDIQRLTMQDVMYIRQVLHPTQKAESKELTLKLVNYICDAGICTAQDIYRDLGYSDKPVLRRLKLFKEFGLIRREYKKWYMPTPRMLEIKEKHLRRICS